MEEKRLECLTMLQIPAIWHPSIDAVIDQFATTAARTLNFVVWTYTCILPTYTVQYNRQFLKKLI